MLGSPPASIAKPCMCGKDRMGGLTNCKLLESWPVCWYGVEAPPAPPAPPASTVAPYDTCTGGRSNGASFPPKAQFHASLRAVPIHLPAGTSALFHTHGPPYTTPAPTRNMPPPIMLPFVAWQLVSHSVEFVSFLSKPLGSMYRSGLLKTYA